MTALEIYLTSSFPDGDREYIDGEIRERNLGTPEHSAIQGWLVWWFMEYAKEWGIKVRPELRMKATPSRFRVPDVMLYEAQKRYRRFVTEPPVLVIEIWSPEDTRREYAVRFADFYEMGIENVWVIDPFERKAYIIVDGEWRAADKLTVKDRPIFADCAEMFKSLDE